MSLKYSRQVSSIPRFNAPTLEEWIVYTWIEGSFMMLPDACVPHPKESGLLFANIAIYSACSRPASPYHGASRRLREQLKKFEVAGVCVTSSD
jgi:hypothetical protein